MVDCEIYLIRCCDNNKCYVGKALKTVGVLKQSWGTNGRWQSHLREAENSFDKKQKGHCVLLNAAILKYGSDKFEVKKICDCTSEEADELEKYYITEFNSLAPNGYNLKTGDNKGKDSDETREKKRAMRLGKSHSEETKKAISQGQLGNKRNQKSKYPEDHSLPKYIICNRVLDEKIGYSVSKFPIDLKNREYVTKTFYKSENYSIDKCLSDAIAYLTQLKDSQVIQEIEKVVKTERNSRSSKKGADKYDMPKYISLYFNAGTESGFVIDGLRLVNPDGTIIKYRKKFNDSQKTMEEKLELTKQHLEYIKQNFKYI